MYLGIYLYAKYIPTRILYEIMVQGQVWMNSSKNIIPMYIKVCTNLDQQIIVECKQINLSIQREMSISVQTHTTINKQ